MAADLIEDFITVASPGEPHIHHKRTLLGNDIDPFSPGNDPGIVHDLSENRSVIRGVSFAGDLYGVLDQFLHLRGLLVDTGVQFFHPGKKIHRLRHRALSKKRIQGRMTWCSGKLHIESAYAFLSDCRSVRRRRFGDQNITRVDEIFFQQISGPVFSSSLLITDECKRDGEFVSGLFCPGNCGKDRGAPSLHIGCPASIHPGLIDFARVWRIGPAVIERRHDIDMSAEKKTSLLAGRYDIIMAVWAVCDR